jgi:hypothetical protein
MRGVRMGRARVTARAARVAVLACLLLPLLLAACDGGSTPGGATVTPTGEGGLTIDPALAVTVTPLPSPEGLSEEDRVGVYLAVIGRMLEPDLGTRFVYISPYLGQGEFLDNPDTNTPVPPDLMERLEPAYADRQFEIRDFEEAIRPLEEGGQVKNDGIFVTLGPISNDGDGVAARASYYRSVGDARGDLYTLNRDGGGWQVVEQKEEWNNKTLQETPAP